MIRISVIVSLYNGMRYLEGFLSAASQQSILSETEYVIIHNAPSEEELSLIRAFQKQYASCLKHIIVPRENLYASWNRGICAASSDIVAIWNIDDVRVPDSLERQLALLEANPSVALTYGDHSNVDRYGLMDGPVKHLPEFDAALFMQRTKTGPFVAWKKKCRDVVGLFDEQFRSTGDFDYWVRIASHFQMKKTPGGILGHYLNEHQGLSTDGSGTGFAERNVVNLRYGNYHRLKYKYLKRAAAYRIHEIRFDGKWHPVRDFIPDYERIMAERKKKHWFFSLIRPLLGLPATP